MIYSLLPGSDKINFLSCLCQESWIRLADKFCGYNLFMKVLLALLHLNSNLFLVVLSSAKTVLIMETDCPINSYSRFFDTSLLLWQPQESQQIKTHSQLFASFEQRVFLLDIADQASFQEYEKLLCADDFFSCDKRINVLSLPG